MIIIRKTAIHKGLKFNRLEIIEEVSPEYTTGGNKKRMVKVKCDCGKIKIVQLAQLASNKTKSCGCLNLEKITENKKVHGKSGTRIYKIWKDMKKRCSNAKNNNYHNYGGRGIFVCEEWLTDFMSFYNWSVTNGYNEVLSIDRINVNGNYEPGNCRWITIQEQKINTRKQRPFRAVNPNGKEYIHDCIKLFAQDHDLSPKAISDCLNNRQKTHKSWRFARLDDEQ